jgi:hypothetical protein
MKGYRKPSGVYIELDSTAPVSDSLVEVALRPSADHIFADSWQSAPLNAAVCWRAKTVAEQTADKNTELQAFLDTAGGKALKALVTVLINKNVLTLAEVRAVYRTL